MNSFDDTRHDRSLRAFYVILCLGTSMAMAMPMYMPLMWERGYSNSQVFYLEAYFILLVTALQTPTGYLADVYGRKKCLLVGGCLMTIATFWLVRAYSLIDFVIIQSVFAIGISCIQGADVAFLRHLLKAQGRESEYQGQLIIALGFANIARATFFVIGAFLLPLGMLVPFGAAGAMFLLYALLSLVLFELPLGKKQKAAVGISEMLSIAKTCLWKDRQVASLIYTQALFLGTTYIGFWYCCPLFQELGIAKEYFGFVLATYALFVALAIFLTRKFRACPTTKMMKYLYGIFFVGVAATSSNWLPLILSGLAILNTLWGASIVFFYVKLGEHAPEGREASVYSIAGMILNASQLTLLLINATLLECGIPASGVFAMNAALLSVVAITLIRKCSY